MRRVDAPEILDSDACSPAEARAVLAVLGGINRRFGGVATTQRMVERAAQATGINRLSLLEVGAGSGELPFLVRRNVARREIKLEVTLLDLAHSHLAPSQLGKSLLPGSPSNGNAVPERNNSVVANALALPFRDNAFDLVSSNLFAHHLMPAQLHTFFQEAMRVCRRAVLINDLVRHPLHLALVYASFPLMRNRIAWLDGLTSVRRAYVPEEIRSILVSACSPATLIRTEISRHFLYRMGVILWKTAGPADVV
jgi:ubiquinone/menaquinone biosynthesis C-methylase UbiE